MESTKEKYADNALLLDRAAQGDEQAAEELIKLNAGLVRSIALRFRDRGTEMEDLIQIGTIGMLRAIRSFDPSRGTVFSTYAVPLIIGEIRRHLRDDGLIKVSRQYKRAAVQLMNLKNRIMMEEGREASLAELAQGCAMSISEAAVALDSVSPVASLSETVYGDEGATLESVIPSEDAELQRLGDNIALSQAISRMPVTWQKIVLLRYYRDMTQQQTATALGLSQVKISREEKKIFEFLRNELTG